MGLRPGVRADITILDGETSYVLDAAGFASLSRNCPFNGRRVSGSIAYTVCDGELKYVAAGRTAPVAPERGKAGKTR
jgi:dihydroorotase